VRAEDRGLRRFADLCTVALLLVVLMGAIVTDTGSGRGCGGTWPLCNGRLVPALAISSMIEYSHRAVAGVVAALVVVLAVWAWRAAPRRPEVRALAIVAAGFVWIQALLGGLDVLYPQSAALLALHFGFSLLAFAGALLLSAALRQAPANAVVGPPPPLPGGLRALIWAGFVYVYALIYLGAYIAHTSGGMACQGWPLCSGALIPALRGATGVAFLHRLGALGALVLIAALHLRLRRLPGAAELQTGSRAALGFVLLQIASGAALVETHLAVWAVVVHGTLVAGLFGALAFLCLQAWRAPTATLAAPLA